MKFPISVLHDLAKTLRGREHMSIYPGISAYSDVLIAQHTLGNCVIHEDTFETLHRTAIENYMPLPYNSHQLCAAKNTIQLENLPVITATDDFGWSALFGERTFAPNWMVIAEGDDGKLYALAHGNQHFFEAGELIKEVAKPNARVRVGHVHISNDFVTWELCNWAAAAVIFGKACSNNIEFLRCSCRDEDEEPKGPAQGEAELMDCCKPENIDWNRVMSADIFRGVSIPRDITWDGFAEHCLKFNVSPWDFTYNVPTGGFKEVDTHVLETVSDAERIFVPADLLEEFGIEVKDDLKAMSVASILQAHHAANPDNAKADTDPEAEEIRAKLLKTLNFDAIAADFRALPKSKRTVTNLKKIIRQYNA